ncbi:unnamed protein product [Microthlaspi erraticum]|uniref:Uncharacterized protein n=1 Tax=Microthlaspi erraticum TaxID=1685480 RepID=A0A6D2IG99_9BRAS|nr:unnamed protein product [Microthlaspi erraticum]
MWRYVDGGSGWTLYLAAPALPQCSSVAEPSSSAARIKLFAWWFRLCWLWSGDRRKRAMWKSPAVTIGVGGGLVKPGGGDCAGGERRFRVKPGDAVKKK